MGGGGGDEFRIPCNECEEVYVGETKRTLKVRLNEHRQAVRRGDQKNGIAVHVQKRTTALPGKAPQYGREQQDTGREELWRPSRSRRQLPT